jgi:dephospho-CoA kinase
MKTIGISGKIGSGKSLLSKMLLHLGYSVFDSDLAAIKCYNQPEIQKRVHDIVGYIDFESLEWKKILASKIFSDNDIKIQIESLIHAEVSKQFDQWKAGTKNTICFKESALIQAFNDSNTDELWIVYAPIETRFNRVKIRSNMTREDFEKRKTIQEKLHTAFSGKTIVFTNDNSTSLLSQLERALQLV